MVQTGPVVYKIRREILREADVSPGFRRDDLCARVAKRIDEAQVGWVEREYASLESEGYIEHQSGRAQLTFSGEERLSELNQM